MFVVCSLTSQQLQGIALQNQQSKRQNTQKSYGVQDRKFKVGAAVIFCCVLVAVRASDSSSDSGGSGRRTSGSSSHGSSSSSLHRTAAMPDTPCTCAISSALVLACARWAAHGLYTCCACCSGFWSMTAAAASGRRRSAPTCWPQQRQMCWWPTCSGWTVACRAMSGVHAMTNWWVAAALHLPVV